jgi:multiple antibiotic resistance protein
MQLVLFGDRTVLQFFLVTVSSLFFLVDPIATVPVFLVMTSEHGTRPRRRMAARASLTCFGVLTGFSVLGNTLFQLLGITLAAFQMAGGLILLLIGLDMVQARRSRTKQVPGETEEAVQKDDVGIVPLGVPMLAGPGAISTVMVFMSQTHGWLQVSAVLLAIALTSGASYLILAAAGQVRRHISETGINIMTRIMGMLVAALAIQFMATGLAILLGSAGREVAGPK